MMSLPMNVLFVVAEMAPLVKVGGVGDVGGSLPRALRALGVDVRVALPYYATIERQQLSPKRVASLADGAAVWQTEVAGVPVYLIEDEPSFGRSEVYGYDDDPARFLAFCDGLLTAAGALDWQPDVLHLHDWQPGFLAARLASGAGHLWQDAASICTIHNLAFGGGFDAAFAKEHGLARQPLVAPRGVGRKLPYSALAQSILHADLVSTVSPTYAREILTPDFGGDILPLLARLGDRLCGILNGIDTQQYDPATDPHLAARFDAERLDQRIENKRELQRRVGLPIEDDTPLVGMVSRLFWQKGPDLAAEAVASLVARQRFQFVVLGQGNEKDERSLVELAGRYPQQVAARIAFDLPVGQLIYGGCDLFLMPSRYEPCGLGQLIAMRYGAVPVVRRTGGLADSVEAYQPGQDRGTGFVFDEATPEATAAALEQALAAYRDRAAWRRLQLRTMAQDYSWEHAAGEYVELYRRAVRVHATGSALEESR